MTVKMLYFGNIENPFQGLWVEVTTTKNISQKLKSFFFRDECYQIFGRVGFGHIPIENFNLPILNLEIFIKLAGIYEDYGTDAIISMIDDYGLEEAVEIMSEWEFMGDCWEAEDYAKDHYRDIIPKELENFIDWNSVFHEQILFTNQIIWFNGHIWKR